MATINSLPVEVIDKVLIEVHALAGPLIVRCALVCSDWKDGALALLYQSLTITSQVGAKTMATGGGLGKYQTSKLIIQSIGREEVLWCDEMGVILMSSSLSVKDLTIGWGVTSVPATILADTYFPDLRTLVLKCKFEIANVSPSHLTSPFPLRLSYLAIFFNPSQGLGLILDLLVRSMTRPEPQDIPPLWLGLIGSAFHHFLFRLHPLTKNVQSLGISSDSSTELRHADLVPFLTSPSLFNLHLQCVLIADLKYALDSIPRQLTYLRFSLKDETSLSSELIQLLDETIASDKFPSFQVLGIDGVDIEQLKGTQEGSKLIKKLEEAGVDLMLG